MAGQFIARGRGWIKEALRLLVMLVVISLALDLWRKPSLPEGAMTASFTLLDGQQTSLAALSQDQPLLVYYWASWCGVCRFTNPTVQTLFADGKNVLSVALRSGDDPQQHPNMAKKGFTLATLNDPQGQLATRWQVHVTPTFLIIKKGQLISTTSGWTSSLGLRLRLAWAAWQ